ncbi:diguanylate cyclase [Wenzhouxiangella limi]|uniref:Diguanylate cyclase n=1 Tax=Wenzhouxiangella limi TaxID=2707351 RepID=A0A845V2E7_9GAMM|nr:diguanylate cyclase [Wenzhouxiangella limi]NDY95426.1 diguanylate cyclase [Wenzhouxiangella limi]
MGNPVHRSPGSVSKSLASWLFFSVFLFMTSVLAAGGLPMLVPGHDDPAESSINVLEHAEFLRDPSGRLGVDQVTALAEAGTAFAPLESDHLRKGFSSDVFWLNFSLTRNDPETERLFLVAWPPFIDRIDLFTEVNGAYRRVQQAGDHVPVGERAMPVPETVFPVVVGPDPVSYLLRVETRSVVSLSLELKNEERLVGEGVARWIRHGVFLGMSLTAMLLAVLAAIWLRQSVFVIAAAYLFCFFGFQFLVNGNDQLFLYPDRPWLSDRLLGAFTCAAAGLMAWFVTSYLESETHFPRLTKVLQGLAVVTGVGVVISLFGGYHLIAPGVLALIFLILVAMLGLFVGMIPQARVRALAMLVMFLPAMAAAFFQILHSTGWLGSSLQACQLWDMAALAQMPFAAVAILIRVSEAQQGLARAAGYRLLVENQVDLVVKVDPDGRFQFVSRSYCETFGKSAEELIGSKFAPLVHEEDVEATLKAFRATLAPPFVSYVEQRAWTVKGWRWLGWSDTAVLDDAGRPEAVIGVGRDVTDRVKAENALSRSRRQLEMALDVARIGCYSIDTKSGTITADERCVTLLGHDPDNFSLDWPAWKALLHPDDRERVIHLTEARILAQGEAMEMEYRIRHRDGGWRWWLDRVTSANAVDEKHRMLGLVQDITERKRALQQLEFLVRHDELTGLFNRRGIAQIARHQLAQAHRAGLPCCFAIADLDRFKRVNDTWGHEVGDRVLKHVAECLRTAIRSGDWVGRWGGEEFLLVLPQTPLEEAREALERVRQAVADAVLEVDGAELAMTISIGVAAAGPVDLAPDSVIVRADASLYAAKQGGRNQVVADYPARLAGSTVPAD